MSTCPTRTRGEPPAADGAARSTSPAPRRTLEVVLHGRAARAVLADGSGRVLAVLAESVYLESRGGVCCLGPRRMGAGPLNALLDGEFPPPAGLTPGSGWSFRDQRLRLAGGPELHLDPAQIPWWPRAPRFGAASLSRGLAALAAAAPAHTPAGSVLAAVSAGLAGRGFRTAPTVFGTSGDAALAALHGWLRNRLFAVDAGLPPPGAVLPLLGRGPVDAGPPPPGAVLPLLGRGPVDAGPPPPGAVLPLLGRGPVDAGPPPPGAVLPLLGRGPGLTPSGDDLLAGVLVALRALGAGTAADRLAAAITPEAPARTSRISAAHLAAAAAGAWLAPLHAALDALARGEAASVSSAIDALTRVGHASGRDALAGAWLAADAVAGPPRAPCRAPLRRALVAQQGVNEVVGDAGDTDPSDFR